MSGRLSSPRPLGEAQAGNWPTEAEVRARAEEHIRQTKADMRELCLKRFGPDVDYDEVIRRMREKFVWFWDKHPHIPRWTMPTRPVPLPVDEEAAENVQLAEPAPRRLGPHWLACASPSSSQTRTSQRSSQRARRWGRLGPHWLACASASSSQTRTPQRSSQRVRRWVVD